MRIPLKFPTLSAASQTAMTVFPNMSVEHMGGGCFALHYPLSDESYLLITSSVEEHYAPRRMDEPVLVGHYTADEAGRDDDVEYRDFDTLREALQELYGNCEGEEMPAELQGTEPDDGILGLYLASGWTVDQQDDLVVTREGTEYNGSTITEFVVLRRSEASPTSPISAVDYSAWQDGAEIAQLDGIRPLHPLLTLSYRPFMSR